MNHQPDPPQSSSSTQTLVFIEAGMLPDVLAAEGISSAETLAMLAAFEDCDTLCSGLIALHGSLSESVQQIALMTNRLASNPLDDDAQVALAAAEASRTGLSQQLVQARSQLRRFIWSEAGRPGPNAASASFLAGQSQLPIALSAYEGESDFLSTLKQALVAERRATRRGETLESKHQTALLRARSDLAVTQAQVNLNANLHEVSAVLDSWGQE
ncbi:MAG: hypothetical protein KF757_05625 [Phycisphaeraceae bacterium]|nr:hypothetical protein [Phycisphaeraceae bacterium]MCW5763652.1 hypothetical protein [Phycisphaeraceae bacterium]